ncbi:hypothetical protein T4B_9941 [Trichinella pseudospiralis]|uniref:Uncharacterized protein n=1 Tax=Trichinella pseudospiralis TaxID=6337 RepID=A0A0V1JED8_TRIPS|nr:hypothetical protein T4B_9941 [Trichinella pseudospiralis]KRZ33245.1 hypothetical protein T4C_991 [Trichinella pseudospiralis]
MYEGRTGGRYGNSSLGFYVDMDKVGFSDGQCCFVTGSTEYQPVTNTSTVNMIYLELLTLMALHTGQSINCRPSCTSEPHHPCQATTSAQICNQLTNTITISNRHHILTTTMESPDVEFPGYEFKPNTLMLISALSPSIYDDNPFPNDLHWLSGQSAAAMSCRLPEKAEATGTAAISCEQLHNNRCPERIVLISWLNCTRGG